MGIKRQAPQGRPESQVLERTKTKRKLKQPPLYKVLFHNDDYTPMEFVVLVLMQVFDRSEVDATQIMLHVHNSGIGVAGLYPFSVAETKVSEVMAAAEKAQYPLLVTMEPADDGEDRDSNRPSPS
jgi:ATP-dependent Clp protease adaptor protein ClpS